MESEDRKANQVEENFDQYFQDIFQSIETNDIQRFKDILDKMDRHELSSTKKMTLNAGYPEADGLPALSLAAGRKHKAITEVLAS
ncbi:unnamed protein product [Rotaria magnacalcarata]|uniref:Uncharacterized protein n=2 Tax=Rotaria magnacalcarata TaxID=392030 RepID=A0A816YAJ6_9BILA|nr:unnamed protein product [Rotaria magnacalcarata]